MEHKTISDLKNLKDVTIRYVSCALLLTEADKLVLLKNSVGLSNDANLLDLINHFEANHVDDELVSKLRAFARKYSIESNKIL